MPFIIEIEGTDGCGKQTQTKKLFEYLSRKNLIVKTLSFPNYKSVSSGPVKMYLNGELSETVEGLNAYQASILYATDRLCTMKSQNKFLSKADVIILDRYTGSNLLHQACKIKDLNERTKFINWINDFEFNILELPKPNLVFFLDMPFDFTVYISQHRKHNKCGLQTDIHEQNLEYLKYVNETSVMLAENQNWQVVHCDNGTRIKTVENIHKEIVEIFENKFQAKCSEQTK